MECSHLAKWRRELMQPFFYFGYGRPFWKVQVTFARLRGTNNLLWFNYGPLIYLFGVLFEYWENKLSYNFIWSSSAVGCGSWHAQAII